MSRMIAAIAIQTGISPTELLNTDPIVLEEIVYLIKKQQQGG